ncbi:MAG: hypothetical protein JST54_10045 [Deltaproteobacteria bacterium]|nr:hypothetical protein [Deltaproteobacteria bacterium]
MRQAGLVWVAAVSLLGCSHAKTAATSDSSAAGANLVYADPALGFEIARPRGDAWKFTPGETSGTTGAVAVPVIVAHRASGAQVVVQVAPAVATPIQFATRLTSGLRSRPGFTTTEVEPIPLAEGAVGFAFTMGDQVAGRVAVVSGSSGKVYVLLATWPQDAPPAVISGVDEIVRSLHTTTIVTGT